MTDREHIEPKGERLQKLLARAGIASRRRGEELIREGRVRVNGRLVSEMGFRVRPGDEVTVDGRVVTPAEPLVYLALHKPRGYLSTVRDERGRPTVLDLLPHKERIYPVGRLDLDSEGLILLTNDGELANRLIHPRYEVEREYRVLVSGNPSEDSLGRLRSGVELEGSLTLPALVERLGQEGKDTWLRFLIREGRKRQVRMMCEAIGHPVRRLIRVRLGPITLGDLPPGKWRALSPDEVEDLRQASSADQIG